MTRNVSNLSSALQVEECFMAADAVFKITET